MAALAEVYRARVTLFKRSAAGGIGAVLPAPPHPTDAASLVSSAREAYLRGDFSASVSILSQAIVEEPLRAEALFILARSRLRLQQFEKVVSLLEPALGTFSTLDESCTARMLHGYAVAIAQDVNRGLTLLCAATVFADSEHIHRSVRAELAYYRGIAHWTKREYAESARLAIEAERAELDVLSVRATQLRAFIAVAQKEYADALRLFHCARQAYALCQGRDVALATQIICQIAALEVSLRSAEIRGSHAAPSGRIIPGTSFGPAVASEERVLLITADAWLYALDGDRLAAFRKVQEAIRIAPTSAWRVCALAVGANVFDAFGEIGNARLLADDAGRLSAAVDWDNTAGEERLALLRLAEVYASINGSAASGILDLYDGIRSTMDPTRALRDTEADPRMAGWDAYVRGLVARSQGNDARAADCLRRSADLFRSCGFLWRAALALIALDLTPVDTSDERPLERAAIIIRDNFPNSFLAARLGWARIYLDPVGRTLTPAQIDVLRRLLHNQTVTEIAAETHRAVSTVRKHVELVQAAFGTHSIVELMLECFRRGIVPPGTVGPEVEPALPRVAQA